MDDVKSHMIYLFWPSMIWVIGIYFMMTSSNGNSFRITGPLCGESPVPVKSPHKGQWRGALMFSLICVWINGWVNNREAGDLRRHRGHYDVNVMCYGFGACVGIKNECNRSNPINIFAESEINLTQELRSGVSINSITRHLYDAFGYQQNHYNAVIMSEMARLESPASRLFA